MARVWVNVVLLRGRRSKIFYFQFFPVGIANRAMMRGGSMFAKYRGRGIPRGSGSRQYYTTPEGARQVETVEEACKIVGEILQNLSFKAITAYVGYKTALGHSPFDRQKYVAELEDLVEKFKLLDAQMKDVEALQTKDVEAQQQEYCRYCNKREEQKKKIWMKIGCIYPSHPHLNLNHQKVWAKL